MKTKSRRGAPHGNRNALKHGFYSSVFKDHERRILSQLPLTDLAGEIELIRVANYRFLQALNLTTAPLDVDTQLAALRAVNLSAQSITSLIRAQVLANLTVDDDRLAALVEHLEAPDPAPDALPPSSDPHPDTPSPHPPR